MLEKVLIGILTLIGLYLIVTAANTSTVIRTLGSTAGGLAGTLQGRPASFGSGGVTIGGGIEQNLGGGTQWAQ